MFTVIYIASLITILSQDIHARGYHMQEQKSQNTDQMKADQIDNTSCPTSCLCYNRKNYFVVNCNNVGLHEVPANIPKNVSQLDLSYNEITWINRDAFRGLNSLTNLDLAENKIRLLHSLAFRGLEHLQKLNLDGNPLRRIENGTLNSLKSLNDLSLKSTNLSCIDHQTFNGLNQLASLGLSDNPIYNAHDVANISWFSYLPRLATLYLDQTGIKEFDLMYFPQLRHLRLSKNNLRVLKSDQFAHGANLRQLYLVDCNITELAKNIFDNLTQLIYLDLSHNRLKSLRNGIFTAMKALEALELQNVSITSFSQEIYEYLPKLRKLRLQYNCIFIFPSFADNNNKSTMPNLSILNLDGNSIDSIPPQRAPLRNLLYLSLKQNRIKNIQAEAFASFPKVNHICLASNWFLSVDEKAFKSKSLEILDISQTGGAYSVHNPFAFNPSLKNLDISSSGIRKRSRALRNMRNLQILDLTGGKLGTLDVINLTNTTNITHLNLGSNYILELNKSFFEPLTKLESLKLSNNIISVINASSLPKKYWTQLKLLDLSGNPFNCDCNLLWFRQWLKKTNVSIGLNSKPKAYKCVAPANVRGQYLLNVTAYTPGECFASMPRDWCLVTVFIAAAIIGLLSLGASGFHRYRWHVRYWKFIVKAHRRRQAEFESSLSLPYDAFIAYSQSDSKWVIDKLMPRLEGPGRNGEEGLKLFVHHRDWLAGRDIMDNIVSSVQSSRKTVLVVSNSFTKSDWCNMELTLAQSRLFQDERDNVVIILLESLDYSYVNPRLRYEMDRRTYIEWPENSNVGQELFWLKLREALERPPMS